MQHLSGLKNLYALHILSFRTDDNCITVIREFRKYIVDNISHHGNMKLEFLALKELLSYLARSPKLSDVSKTKRQTKASSTDGTDDEWNSDDGADDDDDEYMSNSLKIEMIEGYRFSDVPDVKIFSKEIRSSRL